MAGFIEIDESRKSSLEWRTLYSWSERMGFEAGYLETGWLTEDCMVEVRLSRNRSTR